MKLVKGQPDFVDVDNPGNWSEFTFRPKLDSKKNYSHHAMPCGATPVPMTAKGRVLAGWEFHYDGWHRSESSDDDSTGDDAEDQTPATAPFRSGATRDNMFPECRKGCLDGVLFEKLGLCKERMLEDDLAPDALFFHQLLLPICDTTKNEDDPRKSFYDDVASNSNAYAFSELRIGCGYGHNFNPVSMAEFVRWDGSIIQDGVLGGSDECNTAQVRQEV